jgi:hypothetical protein
MMRRAARRAAPLLLVAAAIVTVLALVVGGGEADAPPESLGMPGVGGTAAAAIPLDGVEPLATDERSCAALFRRGQPVSTPFVCIQGRPESRREAPLVIDVSGYAGGPFEHKVIVEIRTVQPGGQFGEPMARTVAIYFAPDGGMPDAWRAALQLPRGDDPRYVRGPATISAYVESARDGSRVAAASVEVGLR